MLDRKDKKFKKFKKYKKKKLIFCDKYRKLANEKGIYINVISSVALKIMKVGGLKPYALPLIYETLWNSNPLIVYSNYYDEGALAPGSTAAKFFEEFDVFKSY